MPDMCNSPIRKSSSSSDGNANARYELLERREGNKHQGVLSDHTIRLTGAKAQDLHLTGTLRTPRDDIWHPKQLNLALA
jgi:hypothetical protein